MNPHRDGNAGELVGGIFQPLAMNRLKASYRLTFVVATAAVSANSTLLCLRNQAVCAAQLTEYGQVLQPVPGNGGGGKAGGDNGLSFGIAHS